MQNIIWFMDHKKGLTRITIVLQTIENITRIIDPYIIDMYITAERYIMKIVQRVAAMFTHKDQLIA